MGLELFNFYLIRGDLGAKADKCHQTQVGCIMFLPSLCNINLYFSSAPVKLNVCTHTPQTIIDQLSTPMEMEAMYILFSSCLC